MNRVTLHHCPEMSTRDQNQTAKKMIDAYFVDDDAAQHHTQVLKLFGLVYTDCREQLIPAIPDFFGARDFYSVVRFYIGYGISI